MDMVLWHKFTQNEHLKRELLSTGDAELVEVSDRSPSNPTASQGKNSLSAAIPGLRQGRVLGRRA